MCITPKKTSTFWGTFANLSEKACLIGIMTKPQFIDRNGCKRKENTTP